MGLKRTIAWARNEWGIIAKGDQMSLGEKARWVKQWGPFGARTVMYGSVSLALGPLTPGYAASLWAMRQWCRSSMRGLNISADVAGEEKVPEGGFVYASNHQSLLDILVLGAVLPGDFKWATKRSIMNVPFLGWHLRVSGHVPVDRQGGKRAVVDAIKRFEGVLNEDKPLLVFPEGTRTPDGSVQPFKTGAFYAAIRSGKPVIPVALEGTYTMMGKGEVDTGEGNPRHVRVRIGDPIEPPTGGKEGERVVALRDKVQAEVMGMHRGLTS